MKIFVNANALAILVDASMALIKINADAKLRRNIAWKNARLKTAGIWIIAFVVNQDKCGALHNLFCDFQ